MKNVENDTTMSSNSEYGIGVTTNKFVLFGMEEEEDPLELLKRHELEREEKRKNKIALKNSVKATPVAPATGKAKQQKVVPKDQQTVVKKPENQRPKDDRRIPAKKEAFTERRENKPLFKDNEQHASNGYNNSNENGFSNGQVGRAPREDSNGFQRGGGRRGGGVGTRNLYFRGGAGGRGGRGGFNRPSNFDNRGKREYDRHSGSDKTGVKPINKRDGAGPHNWGNIQDECSIKNKNSQEDENWAIEGEPKTADESSNNVSLPEESSKSSQENNTIADSNKDATKDLKEEPSSEVDEEKKELTLDEWRALKGPRSQPQFNIRKAGEGEVLPGEWKGMKVLEKKKEGQTEEEDDEECEYELCVYPQRVGRQKRVQGIDIKFKDGRGHINGDRGGRGGRGFGGRRGPNIRDFSINTQQDRSQPPAPKVDDLEDFPSLA